MNCRLHLSASNSVGGWVLNWKNKNILSLLFLLTWKKPAFKALEHKMSIFFCKTRDRICVILHAFRKKVGRIAFFREIIHGSDKLVSGGPATKQWQQKLNWLFPKLTKYSMRIIIFKLSVFVKYLNQNNRHKFYYMCRLEEMHIWLI